MTFLCYNTVRNVLLQVQQQTWQNNLSSSQNCNTKRQLSTLKFQSKGNTLIHRYSAARANTNSVALEGFLTEILLSDPSFSFHSFVFFPSAWDFPECHGCSFHNRLYPVHQHTAQRRPALSDSGAEQEENVWIGAIGRSSTWRIQSWTPAALFVMLNWFGGRSSRSKRGIFLRGCVANRPRYWGGGIVPIQLFGASWLGFLSFAIRGSCHCVIIAGYCMRIKLNLSPYWVIQKACAEEEEECGCKEIHFGQNGWRVK